LRGKESYLTEKRGGGLARRPRKEVLFRPIQGDSKEARTKGVRSPIEFILGPKEGGSTLTKETGGHPMGSGKT